MVVRREDFLSLQETEALRAVFFAKVGQGAASRRFWPIAALPEIATILRDLAQEVAGVRVVLLNRADRHIGAVNVPVEHVLEHAVAVWNVVEEDLCIMTPEIHDGLCLGLEYYDEAGSYVREGIYELCAWGRLTPDTATPGRMGPVA